MTVAGNTIYGQGNGASEQSTWVKGKAGLFRWKEFLKNPNFEGYFEAGAAAAAATTA